MLKELFLFSIRNTQKMSDNFLSLTVKDDKPLVIIHMIITTAVRIIKVTQAKEYINKDFDKTDSANNQLPEGVFC